MNDLEGFAKQQGKTEIQRTIMEGGAKTSLCGYGGGDCVMLTWRTDPNNEGGYVQIAYCSKAKQVGTDWVNQRTKKLKNMNCPNSNHSLFSGWDCIYADGKNHLI